MRSAPVIELSAEELTELQRTARSSRSSVREVFRARIVIAGLGFHVKIGAELNGERNGNRSSWKTKVRLNLTRREAAVAWDAIFVASGD